MELLGKSKSDLRDFCVALGEPPYRGAQLYQALYAERKFSIGAITNLPAVLRRRLTAEAAITLPTIHQRYTSRDASVRYLFSLPSAEDQSTARPASVEAVFMPSDGRQTICISTQAGCAVDCQFCLTAQLGLIRNLTTGEMVAQVLMPLKEMKERGDQNEAVKKAPAADGGRYIGEEEAGRLALAARTNVVLMGQGEPLLNFENVMGALQ